MTASLFKPLPSYALSLAHLLSKHHAEHLHILHRPQHHQYYVEKTIHVSYTCAFKFHIQGLWVLSWLMGAIDSALVSRMWPGFDLELGI